MSASTESNKTREGYQAEVLTAPIHPIDNRLSFIQPSLIHTTICQPFQSNQQYSHLPIKKKHQSSINPPVPSIYTSICRDVQEANNLSFIHPSINQLSTHQFHHFSSVNTPIKANNVLIYYFSYFIHVSLIHPAMHLPIHRASSTSIHLSMEPSILTSHPLGQLSIQQFNHPLSIHPPVVCLRSIRSRSHGMTLLVAPTDMQFVVCLR